MPVCARVFVVVRDGMGISQEKSILRGCFFSWVWTLKAAAETVPEARAEQTKLVKQRDKFWKDNQAKGAQVKKAVANPEYAVAAEEREQFWAQQQQQKTVSRKRLYCCVPKFLRVCCCFADCNCVRLGTGHEARR